MGFPWVLEKFDRDGWFRVERKGYEHAKEAQADIHDDGTYRARNIVTGEITSMPRLSHANQH